MTEPTFQLAQVNIGRARGEMTDPLMAEFVARLAEINALADASPGFVWRLQTEDGDATAVRPYADTRILINMSVWTDLAALRTYVYRSAHAAVMRRRREWFERFESMYVAVWWVPADIGPPSRRPWGALPTWSGMDPPDSLSAFRNPSRQAGFRYRARKSPGTMLAPPLDLRAVNNGCAGASPIAGSCGSH